MSSKLRGVVCLTVLLCPVNSAVLCASQSYCVQLTPRCCVPHSLTVCSKLRGVVCHPQVGNQVEVRQSDSQYKLATILKLTDQSTYTVGESGDVGGCVCV